MGVDAGYRKAKSTGPFRQNKWFRFTVPRLIPKELLKASSFFLILSCTHYQILYTGTRYWACLFPSTCEENLVIRTTLNQNVRTNIRSEFHRVALKEMNYAFTIKYQVRTKTFFNENIFDTCLSVSTILKVLKIVHDITGIFGAVEFLGHRIFI